MRIDRLAFVLVLVAGVTVSPWAHADKIITVGELAEATSARVLAKAMEARSEAAKDHSGEQGGPTHQNMGGAPKPMILRVSPVGQREYATIRMTDGSAVQMAVGQASEDGLFVRHGAAGGYELIDAQGQVASSFGVPAAPTSPGNGVIPPPAGAGPTEALPGLTAPPSSAAPPIDLSKIPSSGPVSPNAPAAGAR